MKRKLVVIALIALALLLLAGGYHVVERRNSLPDELKNALGGSVLAEAEEDTPAPTPEPTPEPAPTPEPTPRLESGARGEDVKALQKRLKELGFLLGGADGIYGPKTERAVQAFREYLAAPAETPAPEATAAPEATETPAPTATPQPGFVDDAIWSLVLEGGFSGLTDTLESGATGLDVTRLQTRLNDLNYLLGGIDGVFGSNTRRAVNAFQKRNSLKETGVADRETQELLFSEAAAREVRPALSYAVTVNTSRQKVYVYEWSADTQSYSRLVRTMTCSTGLSGTPTPKGTFSAGGPVARWGYFPKWKVWAQYLYRIQGSILFHSVLYTDADEDCLISGSLYKLGQPASHGCVRLSVADARWLYKNCPAGTTVTVK